MRKNEEGGKGKYINADIGSGKYGKEAWGKGGEKD